LTELPTITRNPYEPGRDAGTVSEDDPSGRGAGVSINGLRSAGTNVMLDGVANNDEFVASVGQMTPLDSVQEVGIITNNFTAEYGRASAGIINVTTKSGSNAFHGTAYEFNRVSALASNGFNNDAYGLPKSEFDRNQFGYSVGGPIVKNKLVLFRQHGVDAGAQQRQSSGADPGSGADRGRVRPARSGLFAIRQAGFNNALCCRRLNRTQAERRWDRTLRRSRQRPLCNSVRRDRADVRPGELQRSQQLRRRQVRRIPIIWSAASTIT
jgi:outer membrane receptor protein involved in Fe transport